MSGSNPIGAPVKITGQSNRTARAIRRLHVAISHAQEAIAELRESSDLRAHGNTVQAAVESLTTILSRLERLKAEADTEERWQKQQEHFNKVYGPLVKRLAAGDLTDKKGRKP